MNVEQAANFMSSSILICLGLIVICATLIFLNNLFAKYWKTVKFIAFDTYPLQARFVDETETKTEPKLGDEPKK